MGLVLANGDLHWSNKRQTGELVYCTKSASPAPSLKRCQQEMRTRSRVFSTKERSYRQRRVEGLSTLVGWRREGMPPTVETR